MCEAVLLNLQLLATLKVVRGNVDTGTWATSLPEFISHDIVEQHLSIFMTHRWEDITALVPLPTQRNLIIVGHSHKPELSVLPDGGLKLNPGSCGPRRFKLPVCAASIHIDEGLVTIKIHELLKQEVLMEWSGSLTPAVKHG